MLRIKKMDDVKKINLRKFDKSSMNFNRCITSQKDGELFSTENGRSKIMNPASIRQDTVSTRLNSNECNSQFYYHMKKECYKAYTLIKKLSKHFLHVYHIVTFNN